MYNHCLIVSRRHELARAGAPRVRVRANKLYKQDFVDRSYFSSDMQRLPGYVSMDTEGGGIDWLEGPFYVTTRTMSTVTYIS